MKTVFYDEQCGVCCVVVEGVIRVHTRAPLRTVPIQSPDGQAALASVPATERLASWHLVDDSGRVFSGGDAFAPLLRDVPGARWLVPAVDRMPRTRRAAYRAFAGRRTALARLVPRGRRERARSRLASGLALRADDDAGGGLE